ncbi:MAG: type II secretion system F family protein [Leptolyngbyaceae cyanobacterium]
MPTYVAKAKNAQGKQTKQKVTANSVAEARTALREQGLYVQDLKEAQGFDPNNINLDFLSDMMTSVTVKDKAVFSRQFAVLVNAGVAMVRSLGVLAEQCPNPKMKVALTDISSAVQQGTNLSEAMGRHPQCFDELYVAMVQAGEIGGVLDEVMNRLSKLLEDTARLNNQIKSAMTYPVAVGFIATTVFIGMTVFLLPIFSGIFDELGVDLPMFTQLMMNISVFLRTPAYVLSLIAVGAALMFAYKQYYATPAGEVMIDGMFLKMPLFGDLIEKTAVARFCRTFGSLSRSGVPILTALEIVRDTAGNKVIANAVDAARQEIQSGGMISLALQRENVFPVMAIQMISIGEETGEIDTMLMKIADFYEDEVEQAVKAMTSIMEPIMIVVLGGMVGSILVAMYLPMFKVMEAFG